jgi:predicted lipoprotein
MESTGKIKSAVIKPKRTPLFIGLAILAVLALIALDTKVVKVGSAEDTRQQVFNPDRFGKQNFPRIRDLVIEKAPEGVQLAKEILADKKAAIKAYGTAGDIGAVMPVKLSGVVGEGRSGVFNLSVDGMPETIRIRVQTGPAINGTDLRDMPGDIEFGDFKNQIEYQDAGSGLNRAMAATVLKDLNRDSLPGKVIEVTGVFKLINPKNWLITPVQLKVK